MSSNANGAARSLAPLPVRAHPLVLGVVVFLASEFMFFSGLFAAYFNLRANRATWPPPLVHLDLVESASGTFLLFFASVVMYFATKAMDRNRMRAARWWTLSAIAAAVGFVLLSVHGYMGNAFWPWTNAYGSVYYSMTGFHLLHVTVGIGILTAILIGMRSPALSVDQRAGAESMVYYWHFVFIVWLGIWSTIYFVR
ncbi:MAG TPA: cytochrome c oxidase subunit 3 [Candidatus Baltobacteraceae bacterium]|jgi:cytochrome c oxidase subunit 3|nr:cytochrome c oxidase subunit 3 [Candidatus Baltobacteraceae bacterium]